MATGRDRINKAMQHQQPDRVPVWCQLSLEHIIRNTCPPGEFPGSFKIISALNAS